MERPHILFIDDDPNLRKTLADILRIKGYEIVTAEDGENGLAVLREQKFHLVLLDLGLPGMSGLEVLAGIKADSPLTEVIVMTGQATIDSAVAAANKGAFSYLVKPYEIDQLINNIRRALEKQQAQEESVRSDLELKRQRDTLENLTIELGEKNRQLENEQTLAHKVLDYILPRKFELPGFNTALLFRPSEQMGGDFFDAWTDGDCTHFLIGDISGHSTSAALMMAVSKGIFRSLGYTMTDPVKIVTAANRMLCPMMLESRMFLTLVYVLFDRRDNSAAIVSAGHNPVYHLSGQEMTAIDSTGPVVGWDETDSWEAVRCRFEPGMLLFLYTDGLTDAVDAAGRSFDERLPRLLAEFHTPQALADGIFTAAETFSSGNFSDDVTVFVVGRDSQ